MKFTLVSASFHVPSPRTQKQNTLMAVVTSSSSPSSLFLSPSQPFLRPILPPPQLYSHRCQHQRRFCPGLNASQRTPNSSQDNDVLFSKSRRRGQIDFGDEYEEEEDDEDGDEDRSLDLLVRFVENVFMKVSRRARKAVRSVLPVAISTKLVGFAVNGALILAFLWVLKAFIEVICTLGTVIFASILLIRGVWTGVTYLQDSRLHLNQDDDGPAWAGTCPVT